MKILVLLAHPDKGSFNHAIAHACVEQLRSDGHTPVLQDLYADHFDPLLGKDEIPRGAKIDAEIDRMSRELIEYDGVIVVHPNWWGLPPAILVGWVDRIVRAGVAYRFVEGDNGEGVPVGLMKAKSALIFNTSNTDEKREIAVFGDPLETIWTNCIFKFCGVKDIERKVFRIIVTSTLEQRKSWLDEVRNTVKVKFGIN